MIRIARRVLNVTFIVRYSRFNCHAALKIQLNKGIKHTISTQQRRKNRTFINYMI